MFHSKDERLVFLHAAIVNLLADLGIVDFPCPRFFASRVVAGLEIANLTPAQIDVGDQVAFSDLLMVNVKQDLAGRTVNGSADCIRLI